MIVRFVSLLFSSISEDKLSEAGALLNEIELIHKKFSNLSTQSNAQGKFSSEEKVRLGR